MSRIKRVTAKDNYCVEVLLENGRLLSLHMHKRLQTIRFCMLSDKDFFSRVSTDGNYVRWEDEIEISLTDVLKMAVQ